jgi:hypothetical protein
MCVIEDFALCKSVLNIVKSLPNIKKTEIITIKYKKMKQLLIVFGLIILSFPSIGQVLLKPTMAK